MVFHHLIQGDSFQDHRGELKFFNTLDMNDIIRLYEIVPNDTTTIRGWQAHKKERKWFYCNSGSFIINLIQIDDFDKPSRNCISKQFVLDSKKPSILEISGGYATGFKAQEENSKLLVFSNFSLEESKNDDFRYPMEYWSVQW